MLGVQSLRDLRTWIEWHGVALTAIGTGLLAAAAIAGLVIACAYLLKLREAARIRRLMQLARRYDTSPLAECRAAWARKRLENEQATDELRRLLDFFGTIGFLVKRNYLNAVDVWEIFGAAILCLYADAQQFLSAYQRYAPASHTNFNVLNERIREIEKRQGKSGANPSPDDLKRFFEQQANLPPGPVLHSKAKTVGE